MIETTGFGAAVLVPLLVVTPPVLVGAMFHPPLAESFVPPLLLGTTTLFLGATAALGVGSTLSATVAGLCHSRKSGEQAPEHPKIRKFAAALGFSVAFVCGAAGRLTLLDRALTWAAVPPVLSPASSPAPKT